MEQHKTKSAPLPSIKRLPLYLGFLRDLQRNKREFVSCTHIAEAFNFESVQVRKDLAFTGIIGKPKVGYSVPVLIDVIEDFLGWNNLNNAFLVGAGSLGSAFLGYERFQEYGLKILAAFDVDAAKIGVEIHGKEVLPLEKLPELAARMHVHIAILTVPAAAAQAAAEILVAGGVKGILNFAPVQLNLPEDVIVEDVNLAVSFAALSTRLYQLQRGLKTEPTPDHADHLSHCGLCAAGKSSQS